MGAGGSLDYGIWGGSGAPGTKYWNNTIYGVQGTGLNPNQDGTVSSGEVRNNIVYGSTANIGTFSGLMASNNIVDGTNPLFVNVGASNFHLQASSPAINTGITISQVTTDFDGLSRPQGSAYDIGAFEFSQGAPPPAPPTYVFIQ